LQIKTKIVSCHTADSTQVKQEVNGTEILHPLVFPGSCKLAKFAGKNVAVKLGAGIHFELSYVNDEYGPELHFQSIMRAMK
jgi:hypothetical protein